MPSEFCSCSYLHTECKLHNNFLILVIEAQGGTRSVSACCRCSRETQEEEEDQFQVEEEQEQV